MQSNKMLHFFSQRINKVSHIYGSPYFKFSISFNGYVYILMMHITEFMLRLIDSILATKIEPSSYVEDILLIIISLHLFSLQK